MGCWHQEAVVQDDLFLSPFCGPRVVNQHVCGLWLSAQPQLTCVDIARLRPSSSFAWVIITIILVTFRRMHSLKAQSKTQVSRQ